MIRAHLAHSPARLARRGGIATAAALLVALGGGLHAAAPAHADAAVATSAYGVEILDIDGGVQQAPAPLSEWSEGAATTEELDATDDVFLLNTTRAKGLRSQATPDRAEAEVAEGTYQLRERPAVTFTGLRAVCTTDGSTGVTFDSLAVDGEDVLDVERLEAGYTVDLPDSRYGPTRLHIGERTTDAEGRTTTTALRIEAEAGASEIWRVRLGVVSCAQQAPPTESVVASGLTVTDPSGAALIDREPRVSATGRKTAETITAPGVTSSDIDVEHRADGSTRVSVGAFEQVPDDSPVGPYLWSALRVYGLSLDVAPDGSSRVTFADPGSAVFANGVWVNTGTNLYTGVDAEGIPRVRVHFNERVPAGDGSVTINALRYEDLTGEHPSVIIGQVRWSPVPDTEQPADPENPTNPEDPGSVPEPEEPLASLYAYGLTARGPSPVAPAAVSGPDDENEAHAPVADDGWAGQVSATGLASSVAPEKVEARVGSLELYPGTALETRLDEVVVEVTSDGASMTTGGGVVAGVPVEAGPVEPDTRIAVAGRTTSIVLNRQDLQAGISQVIGVSVEDPAGLGAEVRAAVVTTEAPDLTPVPLPDGGDAGRTPTDGAELGSGAIAQGGPVSEEPTTSGGSGADLALTGAALRELLLVVGSVLGIGVMLVLGARLRRGAGQS